MQPPRVSRRTHLRAGAGLGFWLLGLSCLGAQIFSESFGVSAAGWTNDGQWSTFGVTNNYLQGRFALISGPPSPQTGKFIATNVSSSGAFTGDYQAPGITRIGFSFYAADVLPSDMLFRWHGDASFVYFRGGLASYLTGTGIWHTFVFSLDDKVAGSWTGSSATNFGTALQAVTWLELNVTRNGTNAQHFAVDNVFVDRRPEVAQVAGDLSATRLLINALQTNGAYRIQASSDVATGTWQAVDVLIATNRLMPWQSTDTTNRAVRYFRVSQDEHAP